MSSDIAIRLLILAVLLLLSAFFSSAETALTTVNRIRMRTLAEDGDLRAQTVLQILDAQDKMLSCILIGNNIVNLSASALVTALGIGLFGSRSVGLLTGALTLFILLFGEIVPKNAAAISSEKLSLRYAPVIRGLMGLMTPIIFLVNLLAGAVMRLLRVRKNEMDAAVTEDEIRTMVDVSHEAGETTGDERELINNVYDFGDRKASDIMVPRADMVCISAEDDYDTVSAVYRAEHFTRLPVYEEDRDHIVGILNIRDFCFVEDRKAFSPRDLMYPPYYTFETKKLSELMKEMREHSAPLTVVLDEYGSTIGILTFEDLIEELVGEIRDEYDDDEDDLIRKLPDHKYLIEGSVKLDDLKDRTGLELISEDYESIGGYLIEHLGHLAKKGDKVRTADGMELTAVRVNRNRIEKVLITLPAEPAEDPTDLPPAGSPRPSEADP